VLQVGLRHLAELARDVGDNARDAQTHDVGAQIDVALFEEAREQERELVGGALRTGRGPPRVPELGAVEDAQDDLGVADVGGEQHDYPSNSTWNDGPS
jgi:hypothetical protein